MSASRKLRKPFLGWGMVALAFALYGFGMAPAYYAWANPTSSAMRCAT